LGCSAENVRCVCADSMHPTKEKYFGWIPHDVVKRSRFQWSSPLQDESLAVKMSDGVAPMKFDRQTGSRTVFDAPDWHATR
jgi:hypothetical protein